MTAEIDNALPIEWVENVFRKLTITYGRDFTARWEGLESADVIDDWAHELAAFVNWPEALAWALQNLPTGKPPSVLDFRAICYRAPKPEREKLPAPVADPERVHAEMAKLRSNMGANRKDPKDWARRILANHEAGYRVRAINLKFAREALGVA